MLSTSFAVLVVAILAAAFLVSVFRAKDLGMSNWMRAREDDEQMRAVRDDVGGSEPDLVPTLH